MSLIYRFYSPESGLQKKHNHNRYACISKPCRSIKGVYKGLQPHTCMYVICRCIGRDNAKVLHCTTLMISNAIIKFFFFDNKFFMGYANFIQKLVEFAFSTSSAIFCLDPHEKKTAKVCTLWSLFKHYV